MVKLLSELPDGTGVRFNHLKNSGFSYRGEVQDGKIIDPNGDKRSPTGAAREVDEIIRGDDTRSSGSGWGPSDWVWFSGEGWEELKTDR
jgi:hypothetical protein